MYTIFFNCLPNNYGPIGHAERWRTIAITELAIVMRCRYKYNDNAIRLYLNYGCYATAATTYVCPTIKKTIHTLATFVVAKIPAVYKIFQSQRTPFYFHTTQLLALRIPCNLFSSTWLVSNQFWSLRTRHGTLELWRHPQEWIVCVLVHGPHGCLMVGIILQSEWLPASSSNIL